MHDHARQKRILGSVFVFVLLLRAPLLGVPFERDEGEYAYIAWRLEAGELPYLHWFDQKPPAIFWIYRLAFLLPMPDVVSVRFVAALFAAASACTVFLLTRKLTGTAGATVAALVLAFLSADPTVQGTSANTEVFMLAPMIAACWLFVRMVRREEAPAWQYVVMGLLLGIASAIKQVAAINWIFFVAVAPFLLVGGRRAARTAALALWSGLGVLLVWGAIATFFLTHGGLSAMLDSVFAHNLLYVRALDLETRLQRLLAAVWVLAPTQFCAWCLAGAGIVLAWLRRPWLAIFLAGFLLASAAGTAAGGHFFPHYFQQLAPALAVACGVAAAEIGRVAAGRIRAGYTVLALCLLVLAPPFWLLVSFWREATPEDVVRRVYPGNSFDIMPAVARSIEGVTRPDDEVFIFGAEPEVLFHARRRSASRYIFLFPLYGPFPRAGDRQREVIRELEASEPEVVFVMPNAMFFGEGSDQTLTHWLTDWLRRHYERHATIGVDESGRKRLIQHPPGPAAEPLRELGALFVRRQLGVGLGR